MHMTGCTRTITVASVISDKGKNVKMISVEASVSGLKRYASISAVRIAA